MNSALSFLVWGYYGVRNFGDEVMKHAIIDQLIKSFPECNILVRYDGIGPDHTDDKVQCVYFPDGALQCMLNFRRLVKTISAIDVLLIGGGTIFLSQHKRRISSLLGWLLIILVARLLGKKVGLLSIGIGNIKRSCERLLLTAIFRLCHVILIREATSYAKLGELKISPSRTFETGDVVALFDTALPPDEVKPNVFGISLMPYYSTYVEDSASEQRFISCMAEYLDWLVDSFGCKLHFFCMKDSNSVRDIEITQKTVDVMTRRTSCQIFPYSEEFHSTISEMQNVSFFIGMRLHSIFFPLRCGIPTVGLAVNPKIQNIMREYQAEAFCLDINDVSVKHLKAITLRALERGLTVASANQVFKKMYDGASKNFLLLETALAPAKDTCK